MNQIRSQSHHGVELLKTVILGFVRHPVLPMQRVDQSIQPLFELSFPMVELNHNLNCLTRDAPLPSGIKHLKGEV